MNLKNSVYAFVLDILFQFYFGESAYVVMIITIFMIITEQQKN